MSDFPVAKNAYVAFDGLSIRDKIRERLNQTGIFTDQNFEGSNLAGFNDAVAMSFSLLLYYLNQTSVNGQFTQTTVYENINRIVKELNYNPIGYQTASVNFTMSAENIPVGFYNIPRYSYINIAGINYSLNKDISFTKTTNTKEAIQGISNDAILYQGTYVEFPIFTPAGSPNELVYLTVEDTVIVDNFNIDVYVQTDGVWKKWEKTQSLFLNDYNDEVYELRFNENKKYELKFGDGINGRQLQSTDSIAIYYLQSNGANGEVGVSVLGNKKIVPFNTTQLQLILADVSENTFMNSNELLNLSFANPFPSTYYAEPESIESIRKNAPANFRSQFNLTTSKAFSTFVKTNFANIVQDVVVKNNNDYLDSYIKYFYDLGLTKPQYEGRALFNQIEFADSCNFNNIYIFIVPKTVRNTVSYLSPAQKKLIVDSLADEKVMTSEIVPMDPVYIALDICYPFSNVTKASITNSDIYVIRSANSRRNETSIKQDIETTIVDFFSSTNNVLGQSINIQQLNGQLLSIDGVDQIYTRDRNTNALVTGIHFAIWNPVYFDASVDNLSTVTTLPDFQFPFLNNVSLAERITIM